MDKCSTENEVWKDIKGYEGKYRVSNSGKVFSIRSNKLMVARDNGCGYFQVGLNNGKQVYFYVHRLVMISFVGEVAGKPFVNHIDGDKSNNNLHNLEWCTQSENQKHAFRTKLQVHDEEYRKSRRLRFQGEGSSTAKLTEKDVLDIRRFWADGTHNQFEMSKMYNVTQANISRIVKRLTWKHL